VKITYIGHATILIQFGDVALLTDPNFDSTLGRFLPRVSAPGIALDALPDITAVLLTHAHADHLSFRSLQALPTTPVYAPPAVANWIQKKGVDAAQPLHPDSTVEFEWGTVTAAPAVHAGQRYGIDRWRKASNMYLIDTNYGSVFFAGDTALTAETTAMVEKRLHAEGRTLDVALLPIGYAPSWKVGFRKGHLTSADALTLFERLGARYLIPYHWGTFHHVTATAFDAITELRAQVPQHHRGGDVHILEPGEAFDLALPTARS